MADASTIGSKAREGGDARAWALGLLPFVAAAAALGWAYQANFRELWRLWGSDPNYSYGYFVIPIALFIAWNRREQLDLARMRPRWWGVLPLVVLLAGRFLLYEWNEQYLETATIPLVVASAILAVGGWHLLWVALPSIVFLGLMMPLPPRINSMLAGPLQNLATLGSVSLLQVTGLPVVSEGNVIIVGEERLEVAKACNGLSMLLSFVTLITAMVFLVRRPLWEKVVLLLSTVPIALLSNVLRITATAWCYHQFGHLAGEKIAHDFAGWAMMPTALVLIMVELKILSLLMVDVEIQQQGPLVVRRPGAA